MIAGLVLASAVALGAALPSLPSLPSWTSLTGADGTSRLPPAAQEIVAAGSAAGRPVRIVRGRARPGDVVAAIPTGMQLFAQNEEIVKSPPAILALAPGWEALRDARMLAVATPDEKGAFTLRIDAGEWAIAACDERGWCSPAVAAPPEGTPLDLSSRKRRMVAAIVTDDLGAPIPGATIVAMPRPRLGDRKATEPTEVARGLTDASGRVLLAGLPAVPLDLDASAAGHATIRAEVIGEVPLSIVLPRLAIVTAHVAGPDGLPPPKARARVLRLRPPSADVRRWVPDPVEVEATAGEQGRVVFEAAPGPLIVEALAPGYLPATSRLLEVAPASRISAGQITIVPGVMVRGTVVDALDDDLALQGATITVAGTKLTARSGEDGGFEIGPLAPGAWTLAGEDEDHPRVAESSREITIRESDADLEPVVLALKPAGKLVVRVKDADGQPVQGVQVSLETGGFGGPRSMTDESGEVQWDRVPAREVGVRVLGFMMEAASLMDAMTQRPPPTRVTIEPGKTTVLELGAPGVRVFGTVRIDGVPTPVRVGTSLRMPDIFTIPATEYSIPGFAAGPASVVVDVPMAADYSTFAPTAVKFVIPPGVSAYRHDIDLPSPEQPEPTEEPVRVPGVLRNMASREPLGGWLIHVPGVDLFPTSEQGEFELLLPPDGVFAPIARREEDPSSWDPDAQAGNTVHTKGGAMFGGLKPLELWASDEHLATVRVLDRSGRRIAGARCVVGDQWHGMGILTDPLGRAVLRSPTPGAHPIAVTDDASFAMIAGPVEFGTGSEIVVQAGATGSLRLVGDANEARVQCDGWPVPFGAFGTWREPLFSHVASADGDTWLYRGLPAGTCTVRLGDRAIPVTIAESATAEVDLR